MSILILNTESSLFPSGTFLLTVTILGDCIHSIQIWLKYPGILLKLGLVLEFIWWIGNSGKDIRFFCYFELVGIGQDIMGRENFGFFISSFFTLGSSTK